MPASHQGRVISLGVVGLSRSLISSNIKQLEDCPITNKSYSILATSKVCEPINPMIIEYLDRHKSSEPGHCTILENDEMQQKWFVLTDQEMHITFVMITILDYPFYVATRCIEELWTLFKDFNQSTTRLTQKRKNLRKIRRPRFGRKKKKKESGLLEKEIDSLVIKYDNLEALSATWKTKKDVEELTRQMEDNIREVLQNVDNAELLLEKSQQLLNQTKVFKKRSRMIEDVQRNRFKQILPFDIMSKTVRKYATVAGFTVGGGIIAATTVAACVVSPPIAAGTGAILSGTGCAAVYDLLLSARSEDDKRSLIFWSHTFVPIRKLDLNSFATLWLTSKSKNRNEAIEN